MPAMSYCRRGIKDTDPADRMKHGEVTTVRLSSHRVWKIIVESTVVLGINFHILI